MITKVKLRQKVLKDKKKSLYLDFYPAIPNPKTGKLTRREFLGMYLFDKPKNYADKTHNKNTLELAQQIRQKRDNELNKPEIYAAFEQERLRLQQIGECSFIKYFKGLADKRTDANQGNWMAAYGYLIDFTGGTLTFHNLNEKFCNDFKEYLLNTKSKRSDKKKLASNTALSYFNKFKAALKQSYKDGFLQFDLNSKVEGIKAEDTKREYLTLEELNQLVKAPCNSPLLKRAALFSALTGLRFSDIQKLTWQEVEHVKGQGYFIRFRQKKTKGQETLPISHQAFELLGDRGEREKQVFEGLNYSAYENRHLFQWIGLAGITKHITFHCFRHTFAVLQLANGTDIYTVSKMLGHKELKTTQIYAKVIDQTKRDAADKIKLDL